MSLHPITNPTRTCKPLVAIELDQDARRAQSVKTIRISWKVSRSALGEHAPEGRSPFVTLELAINPCSSDQAMSCSVIDPKHTTRRAIELAGSIPTICVADSAMGIVIESDDPTNLVCHLRSPKHGDRYELVYIRSSIFEQLQVPGGRYEPIGARGESD
tara:strand:- start:21234 stop:21710 length:477 start_codon:yes stop_codon:yes gene_type:complete